MKSVSDLKSALEVAAARERAFIDALSPEERVADGTFEHWSAKDTLVHIAYWRQQMANKLLQLTNPEVDPWGEDEDATNVIVYERYHNTPWEDVQVMLEGSLTNLEAALDGVNQADLVNTELDPWHGGREPWKTVIGNSLTHPISHLAGYLVEHGQKEQALQLQQDANDALLTLDDSPDWRGVALYNLACVQALLGEKEQALAGLDKAFPLAPRLVAWSKEDPDLASLHEDPRFQEILNKYVGISHAP